MDKLSNHLYTAFPPSSPCSCSICRDYCYRPGWWTVQEARLAMEAGFADRMMMEISPDFSFGVLSPAFKGNEGFFALQNFSGAGCTFFVEQKCLLFGKPYQPLECRFCHHERAGYGEKCHHAIEQDWNTSKARRLIQMWLRINGLRLPFRGCS